MLLNQLENVCTKVAKHFCLMIRYGFNVLTFCAKNFFILFDYVSCIFGFFCFIGVLVLFFCFNRVIVIEEIYQLLFYIFFFKTLYLPAVFRVFPHLKTKNKRYTINLKHPLQTKNATPLRAKCVLLNTIKGCKSTLSQKF